MVSKTHSINLIISVCICCLISMLGISLWPVFLIELRDSWELTNTEIGWIGGSYFIGYVIATPIMVGLTDFTDSRLMFITGCISSFIGSIGFAIFANGFFSACFFYALIGAGLAGTYMPGLQVLNARLGDDFRIRAVPWYTSSFGLGTGFSFFIMGLLLTYSNYKVAAFLAALGSLVAGLYVLAFIQPKSPLKERQKGLRRHPLDLRPAFKKPKAMSFIFSYSAHTYELMAFRAWSFALFVFLSSNSEDSLTYSQIATIFGLLTIFGMFASTTGAKFCLMFGRHRSIFWIGLVTVLLAIACAISLEAPLWFSVGLLCFYNIAIMFDSGGLTAGTITASDPHDRGALLAVHSMIGFAGGAIGAPLIGFVLDFMGGETELRAWVFALLMMGFGSFLVSVIQYTSLRSDKLSF
ncbi:MAG: MFS transporter [Paracoccaceae bacterium]